MPVSPDKQWTLRLKRKTNTVLLFVDPAQSLSSVKAALFEALEANTSPLARAEPLPSSPEDIELGRPIDPSDLSVGFEHMEPSSIDELADEPRSAKGKGKAARSVEAGQSLKSLGLRDSSVLAYRWKRDDGDETLGDDEWEVSIPVFEDIYGMEQQLDPDASPPLPELRGSR